MNAKVAADLHSLPPVIIILLFIEEYGVTPIMRKIPWRETRASCILNSFFAK